jgi:hypothetical protein
MKLDRRNMPYAYFIGHRKARGYETILKFSRVSRQYSVTHYKDFVCMSEFNTNDCYLAKQVFRRWIYG